MFKRSLVSGVIILFLILSSMVFATDKPTKISVNDVPEDVQAIIKKSCFGCHNTNSKNEDAKEELDFKKLDKLSVMKQIRAYKHIAETVEESEMPPKKFIERNADRKLTEEEKQVLIAWAKKEAETLLKSK